MPEPVDMAAFWDARAREDARFYVDTQRTYGDADDEEFWRRGEAAVQRLLDALGLALRGDEVVVDLGCGIGRLTRPLAARSRHVEAVDVSAEMLARGRAANADAANVTWHQGDGRRLPLPDASADAVVSLVVLQHLPAAALVLGYVREMGRVLRPGGWAAFQVSTDPAVHAPRRPGLHARLAAAAGRAPRGQDHPAWLGCAVELAAVRAAAADGGLVLERVLHPGTQFCLVAARRCG